MKARRNPASWFCCLNMTFSFKWYLKVTGRVVARLTRSVSMATVYEKNISTFPPVWWLHCVLTAFFLLLNRVTFIFQIISMNGKSQRTFKTLFCKQRHNIWMLFLLFLCQYLRHDIIKDPATWRQFFYFRNPYWFSDSIIALCSFKTQLHQGQIQIMNIWIGPELNLRNDVNIGGLQQI